MRNERPLPEGHQPSSSWSDVLRSRWGIGTVVLLAIGAFLLTTEHRAHLFGALPWLLLLLCPLMHLFMHHGHDHGASAPPDASSPSKRS